jgi:hypothetical protein
MGLVVVGSFVLTQFTRDHLEKRFRSMNLSEDTKKYLSKVDENGNPKKRTPFDLDDELAVRNLLCVSSS